MLLYGGDSPPEVGLCWFASQPGLYSQSSWLGLELVLAEGNLLRSVVLAICVWCVFVDLCVYKATSLG